MSWLALALAPVLAVVAAAFGLKHWLRRRYLVVTVRGASMTPTFQHGDRVLVLRRAGHRVVAGQVALVDLPERLRPIPEGVDRDESLRNRRVIKRIAAVGGDPSPLPNEGDGQVVPLGHLVLLGDNPLASGDSRQFGAVPADAVIGVVLRPLDSRPLPARTR